MWNIENNEKNLFKAINAIHWIEKTKEFTKEALVKTLDVLKWTENIKLWPNLLNKYFEEKIMPTLQKLIDEGKIILLENWELFKLAK